MPSQTIFIHVNSDIDRTPTDVSTTSWTTYLSSPILVSNSSEVRVSLEACEIPNVLYNFGAESSVFWWIHDPLGANILKSVTIATNRNFVDGNALTTYLNTQLTSIAAGLAFSYDTTSNKLSITNNNAVAVSIIPSYRYSINPNTYNMAIDKLGFTQNITSNLAAGASLTSQSVLRLLRTNCYYLTCEEVSSSQKEAMAPNPYRLGHKIIGRITAGNFGSLSQLQYLPASNLKINSQSISRLQFNLLDDNLYPITMYAPITLTLKVHIS